MTWTVAELPKRKRCKTLGLPLYPDSIGTILVSVLGGLGSLLTWVMYGFGFAEDFSG